MCFLPEYTNDPGKGNQKLCFTKSGLKDLSQTVFLWKTIWKLSYKWVHIQLSTAKPKSHAESFRIFLMYYMLKINNAKRISNSLLPVIAPDDGTEISVCFWDLE